MKVKSPSFFELPFLSAHGTLLIHLLAIEPLHDAVDVKAMGALSPHERTVVAGEFAVRTAAVKSHATNATVIVVGHPFPHGHPRPVLYFHLHAGLF